MSARINQLLSELNAKTTDGCYILWSEMSYHDGAARHSIRFVRNGQFSHAVMKTAHHKNTLVTFLRKMN